LSARTPHPGALERVVPRGCARHSDSSRPPADASRVRSRPAGHRLSRVQAPLDEVFRPPASTRWNLYSLRMRIQVPAPFGSRPRRRERARVRKETRMRIGLMIGPERGRYRHKVAQLIADAEAAEEAGFTSIWVPQIPGDFDAFTAIALMAQA